MINIVFQKAHVQHTEEKSCEGSGEVTKGLES